MKNWTASVYKNIYEISELQQQNIVAPICINTETHLLLFLTAFSSSGRREIENIEINMNNTSKTPYNSKKPKHTSL